MRMSAPAPVVVMGGAEHGPVMLEIVPVFEFMYEDAGAVRAAAKAKVEAELAKLSEEKKVSLEKLNWESDTLKAKLAESELKERTERESHEHADEMSACLENLPNGNHRLSYF